MHDLHASPPRLCFRVPLDSSRLMRIRERIRDYLRFQCASRRAVDDMVLCIEEACTNAIRHSGSNEGMEISLSFDGDLLSAVVTDFGAGFDTASFDPTRVPDVFGTGGRGLFLIATLVDDLDLRVNGGTQVHMRKRVRLTCDERGRQLFTDDGGVDNSPSSRESQARLLDTLEGFADGFAAVDWEWRCVYVNPVGVRLLGGEEQGLVGRLLWQAIPGIRGTRLEERCREAMELGRASHFEFRHLPSAVWYEFRVYPSASGISLYFTDITLRKDRELEREQLIEELEEREREVKALLTEIAGERDRLNAFVAQASAAVVSLDTSGRIVEANRAFAGLVGSTHEELVGRRLPDLLPREGLEETLRRVLETGEPMDGEGSVDRLSAQEGHEKVFLDWRLVPLRDMSGQIDGLLLTAVDITDRVLRARYAEAQSRILETMSVDADPAEAVDAASEQLRDALGADSWAVWEYQRRGWVEVQFHHLMGGFEGTRVPASDAPYASEVRRTRRVLAVDNIEDHPLGPSFIAGARGVKSLLVAPLPAPGWRFRVLQLTWHAAARRFTSAEVDFVSRATVAVSSMIENARLYQEVLLRQSYSDALNEIGGITVSSLQWEDVVRRVVGLAKTAIGSDSCSVGMLGDGEWELVWASGDTESAIGTRVPAEMMPSARQAIREQRVVTVEDYPVVRREKGGLDPAVYAPGAAMVVPLMRKGMAIGGLFFAWAQPRRFHRMEIEFVRGVGNRLAQSLDNARLYEAQRHIARTLQEHLIHRAPSIPGLELGMVDETASEPELVGGDFQDVFLLDDGRVALLIGDVEGKGIRAAGLTETVRTAARTAALVDASPAFILTSVNRLLEREERESEFVTAFFATLDPRDGSMVMSTAGHPPAVVCGAEGCASLRPPVGPPLGAWEWGYEERATRLAQGDLAVLFTDGLTEARRRGELFGAARVEKLMERLRDAPCQAVVERLRDAALEFGGQFRDDVLIMALRLHDRGGGS